MKLNIKARHFVPGAARHVLYNLRSFAISITHAAPESPKPILHENLRRPILHENLQKTNKRLKESHEICQKHGSEQHSRAAIIQIWQHVRQRQDPLVE
jgi:hypothetical protein